MTFSFDDVRECFGWCPNALAPAPFQTRPGFIGTTTGGLPEGVGGDPAGSGWLQRYRNRLVLWTLFYGLAFIPFAVQFSAMGLRTDLFAGIIAAVCFTGLSARRLLRQFDTLKGSGHGAPETGREGYLIIFMIAGMILAGAGLLVLAAAGMIPLQAALTVPAVAAGFAFVPLYVLALVTYWERKNGMVLLFDKAAMEFFARKEP